MSGLPPGADMSMTGRFAPQAADQKRPRLGEIKAKVGFDVTVFGSL